MKVKAFLNFLAYSLIYSLVYKIIQDNQVYRYFKLEQIFHLQTFPKCIRYLTLHDLKKNTNQANNSAIIFWLQAEESLREKLTYFAL